MPGVSVDVSKMKISELKKELTARGLSLDGKKNELQERLEEALAGEEDGESTKKEGNAAPVTKKAQVAKKTAPKRVSFSAAAPETKIIKLDETATEEQSAETTEEKTPQEKRAERFGVPLSAQAKKAARAARFGIVDPDEKKAARAARFGITESSAPNVTVYKKTSSEDIDKMKARAARFGEVSSKTLKKVSLLEKKKELRELKKEAAAAVSAVPSTPKTTKVPITLGDSKEAENKVKRAERFAEK